MRYSLMDALRLQLAVADKRVDEARSTKYDHVRGVDRMLTRHKLRDWPVHQAPVPQGLYVPRSALQQRRLSTVGPLDELTATFHEHNGVLYSEPQYDNTDANNPVLLSSPKVVLLSRDLGGGAFVGGTLLGEPVRALRPRRWTQAVGVTMIDGLTGRGNVSLPVHSGVANTAWRTEHDTTRLPETQDGTAQVALPMRHVGARTMLSRQLLKQSSVGVEQWVANALRESVDTAIDTAVIAGSGADGEPLGLVNVPGIATVDFGTDGEPTRAELVKLHGKVTAADGVDPTFVAPSVLATKLRETATDVGAGRHVLERENADGDVVARTAPLVESNACPAGTVAVGDWPLCVVGEWDDAYDVVINPYGHDGKPFTKGEVEVVVWASVGIGFAQRAAFAFGQ